MMSDVVEIQPADLQQMIYLLGRVRPDLNLFDDFISTAMMVQCSKQGEGEGESLYRQALAGAQYRLFRRRKFERRGTSAVPVVSLGADCMPFDTFARYGFGASLDGVQLVSPFSLAVHKVAEIERVLQDGWGAYNDTSDLCVLPSLNGISCVARKDNSVLWNHHTGPLWTAENFGRFIRYAEEAIDRFDRFVENSSSNVTVFVIAPTSGLASAEEWYPRLRNMLNSISMRMRNSSARLVALSRPRQRTSVQSCTITVLDEQIIHIERALPDPRYTWWKDTDNTSGQGLKFEADIVDALSEQIGKWST